MILLSRRRLAREHCLSVLFKRKQCRGSLGDRLSRSKSAAAHRTGYPLGSMDRQNQARQLIRIVANKTIFMQNVAA